MSHSKAIHPSLLRERLAKASRLTLGLWLLVSGTVATALPGDRDLPIKIHAQRATLSEREGSTIYSGDVVLVQGQLVMRGDRLEIYSDTKNKEVKRVIVHGRPATVVDQPDPKKPPVQAEAKTIRYLIQEDKLELQGEASVDQDGNSFSGETIDYFIESQRVEAQSGNEGPIEVIIKPPKK